MSKPKVSVIVPCHNLGRYLDEAIDSVLAQTFDDLEILVVDDGSTDPETIAILADYARPKTRVIRSANRGVSGARNLAIENSAGEYICALDADDRLAPTFLEKTIRVLDHDPSVAFVSTWLRTFGDEEWEWHQDRCDLVALLAECTVMTAAPVRRAVLREVGGYDLAMGKIFAEDWDLWIRIVERGHRGMILPEVLFHYRRTSESNSRRWDVPEYVSQVIRALVEKHEASFREHLSEVLRLKEQRIGKLLLTNYELEREVDDEVPAEIERRKQEVERLRRRVDGGSGERPAHQSRVTELEAALRHAQWEARALRNSISWRVMAPVRAVYDLLMKVAPGR